MRSVSSEFSKEQSCIPSYSESCKRKCCYHGNRQPSFDRFRRILSPKSILLRVSIATPVWCSNPIIIIILDREKTISNCRRKTQLRLAFRWNRPQPTCPCTSFPYLEYLHWFYPDRRQKCFFAFFARHPIFLGSHRHCNSRTVGLISKTWPAPRPRSSISSLVYNDHSLHGWHFPSQSYTADPSKFHSHKCLLLNDNDI